MELAVDGDPSSENNDLCENLPEYGSTIHLALTERLSQVAGHVSAVYKGCLLVWGGYYYSREKMDYRKGSDLYIYPYGLSGDLGVWMKVLCSGGEPKPNCGATSVRLDNAMYVFGGAMVLSGGGNRRRNPATSMLWRLDLDTAVWEIVSPRSKVPTPRDKSASWVVGRKFYFFGGYGPNVNLMTDAADTYLMGANDFIPGTQGSCWNDQLLEFDVDTSAWRLLPKLGDVPSPRAAAGAAFVKDLNTVFLFGGRHEDGRLNDLYRFDVNSYVWTKIDLSEQPAGRSWCTLTWVPDRKVIVMQGGFSVTESPLDDLWHLDISKCYNKPTEVAFKWVCIRPLSTYSHGAGNQQADHEEEEVPSPYQRFWHTANLISSCSGTPYSEAVLVYGGMHRNPCTSAPCLNSLHVQIVEPPSLVALALRTLASHYPLNRLPSFHNLTEKLYLLKDLMLFKRESQASQIVFRECPSLEGASLKDVFDVLDLSNII